MADPNLTHRPAMFPFLAEYTADDGTKSGGWAVPSMITEPLGALGRLLNTPAGTMPDPQDPQNQTDMLTALMAIYGGNAMKGMARGSGAAKSAARAEMEAPRAVSFSNSIDDALSNPALLRQMDDIKHAELNSQAKALYGRGIDELTGSQEAQLRGWSDPATLMSDTGKPNPVGAAVASDRRGFTAYHGSPHDFDRFDMSKIGSGEGAQAYGNGLYFADSEAVARSYRDRMQGQGVPDPKAIAPEFPWSNEISGYAYRAIADEAVDPATAAKRAAWQFPELRGMDLRPLEQAIKQGKDAYKGHMYQVRINADPNAFLDWDKPLSQQSENVKEALKAMGYEDYLSTSFNGSQLAPGPGGDLTKYTQAGIPGIKYLDQMSRSAGEGSSNYVVFDDALIDIIKKYGLIPPAVAAGSQLLGASDASAQPLPINRPEWMKQLDALKGWGT